MALSDSTMRASDQRAINLRKRNDLIIAEVAFQGETCWIIKDPVSLKYVRLQAPEYKVFCALDGNATYQGIKRLLEKDFPDRIISSDNLQMLISTLHRNGLLIADNPDQAVPLLERHRKQRNRKIMALFASVLSIRFPGVDPERFLNWLYPKVRWLFTWVTFYFALAMALGAGFLILNNWQEFILKLPEFQRFFSAQNIVFMGLVLMITKVLHELGHGLYCKHFGGECHEIGFMLLVLTPTMYCNTSDSWILPNKWHRAVIGAAGIYVELVLASLCTFIWWYTQPGFVHYFCLNVMFVSGVSAMLFNANPLLRYDGYYIMSDLLEVPNLAQKSRMAILNKLRVWFLGMKPMKSRYLPQRNQELFALYAVASVAYRWFVLFAILFFLSKVFEPYGLESIGHILIGISLTGLVVIPLFKLIKFFAYPGRIRQVKRKNLVFTCCSAALVVYLVGFVKIPHYVITPVVIRPDQAQHLFVNSPGRIVKQNIEPGQRVEPFDVVIQLENEEIRLAVEEQQSVLLERQARKEYLLSLLANGLALPPGDTIAKIDEQIDAARQVLNERKTELSNLAIKSDRSGVLIPPSQRPHSETTLVAFGTWEKTPLDPESRNGYLPEATEIGYIGDPEKMKAILFVEQDDIKLVDVGQAVQIMLDEYPGIRLKGQIRDKAYEDKKIADKEASVGGGPLKTRMDEQGVERPLFVSYEATVPLYDSNRKLLPGFRGIAKVRVGEVTTFQMVTRYILNLIHFR